MELIAICFLFIVGYICGTIAEYRHYMSIEEREKKTLTLPAVTFKKGYDDRRVFRSEFVSGSAVISTDYFKRFLARLLNLIGGRVSAYESLVDRARREAILRMKELAPDANIIVNVRVETSTIGQSADQKQTVGSVEALAYGTAVWVR